MFVQKTKQIGDFTISADYYSRDRYVLGKIKYEKDGFITWSRYEYSLDDHHIEYFLNGKENEDSDWFTQKPHKIFLENEEFLHDAVMEFSEEWYKEKKIQEKKEFEEFMAAFDKMLAENKERLGFND